MNRPALVLLALCVLAVGPGEAGHELPFYPSFYPQEIRIETVDPGTAATLLPQAGIHAYVGGDPFASATPPKDVAQVESLGAWVVATFGTASGPWADRQARCGAAGVLRRALAADQGAYRFHPYPVTPFHADYLQHFDLAEAAKQPLRTPEPAAVAPPLKVRARGAVAEALLGGRWAPDGEGWNVTLEQIDVDDLTAPQRVSVNGWLGPPWLKEGWFHAYLLHGGALQDRGAKRTAGDLYARLVRGAHARPSERLALERRLVSLLGAGCERVVLGYTVRREPFSAEFSQGIENIAYDSQSGFNSAIFLRTAKLKDFPWNGWLRLGIGTRPAAAWNPVGGFTDPAGRLLWLALGDPAYFPTPHGASWIGNRVTTTTVETGAPVAVPPDALVPASGTGFFREAGPGRSVRAKVVYRVLTSLFHDGTRMAAADVLYPVSLAYRWGASRSGPAYDPAVDAGTALLREWLVALRPTRVDTDTLRFGEITFTYIVHTVEVYGQHPPLDPQQAAAVTAPWSPVPWHVLALMEEAVQRGLAAFSREEAARRGIPWLDLVRDQKLKEGLAPLVADFARRGHVPAALTRFVTADDARERWAALRRFYDRHGHFLVTNGPYRLETWSADGAGLQAFRDFTYPLGVGSYDRYPIPRRAYVAKVEPRGDRLEVHADVERIEKFMRSYNIVREPLRVPASGGDARDLPVCRYVVVGSDGEVVLSGTAPHAGAGVFAVDLKGRLKPGPYTVLVALYLGDNHVNPEIRVLTHRIP